MLMIFVGVVVLGATWWDYTRSETEVRWFGFVLGFTRDEQPGIFWAIMAMNCAAGVGAIIHGLFHLKG